MLEVVEGGLCLVIAEMLEAMEMLDVLADAGGDTLCTTLYT